MEMDGGRANIRAKLIQNGVSTLNVDRSNVVSCIIDAYASDQNLHWKEIKVHFNDERGIDMGGLRREVVNCFWDEFERVMDGSSAKVPPVIPSYLPQFYHIGRFVSHAYILTGYFPVNLSVVCAKILINGVDVPLSDGEIVSSFYDYIDDFERSALEKTGESLTSDLIARVITPMLSRFYVSAVATRENLSKLVTQAARYALIAKPFYALSEMRRGMLSSHPTLWNRCTGNTLLVDAMYEMLHPTTTRVWEMIAEPDFKNQSEEAVYDFLRRFVYSLVPQVLVRFLSFITGFSVCSNKKIKVLFNSMEGFERRPRANTCTMTLHLPISYESYTTSSDEFTSVINNRNMWFFDVF